MKSSQKINSSFLGIVFKISPTGKKCPKFALRHLLPHASCQKIVVAQKMGKSVPNLQNGIYFNMHIVRNQLLHEIGKKCPKFAERHLCQRTSSQKLVVSRKRGENAPNLQNGIDFNAQVVRNWLSHKRQEKYPQIKLPCSLRALEKDHPYLK